MGIGVPGEVAIRGPLMRKGYWGADEATRETIRDGWLYTGDIGYWTRKAICTCAIGART